MLASEAIREARNVLMQDGWCQGQSENDRGEKCMSGALAKVFLRDHVSRAATTAATDCVRAATIPQFPLWNDTPGRTIHEVLDAFDRAEKLALIVEEEG